MVPVAPRLFEPVALRALQAPNRIVLSPMGQHSATDGLCDDWHLVHLDQFAAAGVGTVFTGSVATEPQGRITDSCLSLWNDDQVVAFGRLRRLCPATAAR
jgi:2,4-dienoyl-CoA reductase-like NADH-dependent reductase (Old Yellow Enzyme family)